MQKTRRRKLICFGGKRSSGVIRLYGGTLVPINFGEILTYLIVFIIAISIVVAAVVGSRPNEKNTNVDLANHEEKPAATSKPVELSKPEVMKPDTAVRTVSKPEETKPDTAADFLIEVISHKNKEKVEALALAKLQEEQAKLNESAIATLETVPKETETAKVSTTYVAAFSSGTEERIRIAMDIIVGNGFTPEAAAAVVGNALVESQLKPEAANGTSFFGLFQWNSSWWENIKTWLAENGYDIYSYEGQIRAAVECQHWGCMTESRWETLKGLTNIDQAVELFAVFYEGCIGGEDPTKYYSVGTNYQALDLRKSEARQALNVFINGEGYTGSKPYYP